MEARQLYTPTHVGMKRLGQMVPVMSNSPDQWWAESGLILRVTVGSGVHGMAIGGQDDIDEMGVFIEPPRTVIGHKQLEHYTYRTQPEGVCSGPGDLDLVVYSLRKYVRLAASGNPTVLIPLFVADADVQYSNEFGEELREIAHWFASKQAGAKFKGYLQSQRDGLMGKRSGGTRNQGRADIRKRNGFDTKFAAHMLRLGIQGVEFISTGRITLPIPEPDLTYLRDLKSGAFLGGLDPESAEGTKVWQDKKAETLAKAERLEKRIEREMEQSRLPERPDLDRLDDWMMIVHRQHWGW